ncbi:hypothetical protein CHARACLAT_004470 [Characodon lateralis]|uniref:Uncharacterized protein n=1 Tax=Characodon lateralis TaxID=208331 RepID=A0ABU7DNX0_9TELE|nr:hypothetical protein [Characodon lateralis]
MERIQMRRFRDLIRNSQKRSDLGADPELPGGTVYTVLVKEHLGIPQMCRRPLLEKGCQGFPAGPVTFTLVVSWSHRVVVAHRGASMSSPEALPSHSF